MGIKGGSEGPLHNYTKRVQWKWSGRRLVKLLRVAMKEVVCKLFNSDTGEKRGHGRQESDEPEWISPCPREYTCSSASWLILRVYRRGMTTSELSRETGLGPRNSSHSVNSVGVLDRHALNPGVVSDANLPDLEMDRFPSVTGRRS